MKTRELTRRAQGQKGTDQPHGCRGGRGNAARAFTLIELITVMTIILIMGSLARPMIGALMGSNTVDKAIADLSLTLEQARAYALANNTYVRVGFGSAPVSSGSTMPALVAVCLAPPDGTLSTTNTKRPEARRQALFPPTRCQ